MSTGDKKIYMTIPSAAKVIKPVIEVKADVFQASDVKVREHYFELHALTTLLLSPIGPWLSYRLAKSISFFPLVLFGVLCVNQKCTYWEEILQGLDAIPEAEQKEFEECFKVTEEEKAARLKRPAPEEATAPPTAKKRKGRQPVKKKPQTEEEESDEEDEVKEEVVSEEDEHGGAENGVKEEEDEDEEGEEV